MTTTITRDELKAGLDAGTITAVDALPASYYDQQHLPGAVNLVADDVAKYAATRLPDRGADIVTYCSNRACPNSSMVARALTELGYTRVRKYAQGIEDWVEAGLPTHGALAAHR